ncbi:MAG: serine hydrolase domain-containing protein, partial [Pseudomonadota bacterium]
MRTKRAGFFSWITFIAALLAHPFAQPARAQPTPLPDEIRTQVGAILEDAEVPGASIVLIEDGRVSRVSHFGVRDKATGVPVTSDTVFRAGSISKSFTSIAIMQLVERGKLDLDTPASQLLPELV